MKLYETMHLVKGEDLNHHGTLFAARAAAWLVETGFATAACEHGNSDQLVLRSLSNMSFFKPVQKGCVLILKSRVVYTGSTSLMVCVTAEDAVTGEGFYQGYITFVTIDEQTGTKRSHGITLDISEDEEELGQRDRAAAYAQRK